METFIGKSKEELKQALAGTIDHAVLGATASKDDVMKACENAKKYGAFGKEVC